MSNEQLPGNFQPDDELLERYLAGECAPNEIAAVGEWMKSGSIQAAGVRAFESYVVAGALVPDISVSNVKSHLRDVSRGVGDNNRTGKGGYYQGALRRWVGYGAVILLIGIVGLQHFDVAFNPSTNTPARLNTYVTAPGQRAKIDLPDGSTVSLSVASRIRYAKNFGASSRDIHLEGEAYFEVSGNTTRPFTVHTGSTETRVLGTAFGVRKYEDEQSTRIIVNAGKVQVKAAATERVVTAGEAVQATAIDIATIPINASANAWMRGEMVFVKTPLTDVARELERWYGIKIHLNDPSLGEEVVTATLGSQTPQEAVRIITMMFNVRAVNNGSTITISRR